MPHHVNGIFSIIKFKYIEIVTTNFRYVVRSSLSHIKIIRLVINSTPNKKKIKNSAFMDNNLRSLLPLYLSQQTQPR